MKKHILCMLLVVVLLFCGACSPAPEDPAKQDTPVEAPQQNNGEQIPEEGVWVKVDPESSEPPSLVLPEREIGEEATHPKDLVFRGTLSGMHLFGQSTVLDYTLGSIEIGEVCASRLFFAFVVNQPKEKLSMQNAGGEKKFCFFSEAGNASATTVHLPDYEEGDVLIVENIGMLPLKDIYPGITSSYYAESTQPITFAYQQEQYRIKKIEMAASASIHCRIEFDESASGDLTRLLDIMGIYNIDSRGEPDIHMSEGQPPKELEFIRDGNTIYVKGYRGGGTIFFRELLGHETIAIPMPEFS